MRTLYLNGDRRYTVRRDGPSLWIGEQGRAGRRVPVRLVSRVIVTGRVTMESDVIPFLARSGVPVSFLSSRGDFVTTALPLEQPLTSLQERVQRLYHVRDGVARVRERLSARRQGFMVELLRNFLPHKVAFIGEKGLGENAYLRLVETIIPGDAGDHPRAVRGILDGLFHELVLKEVVDTELDPHVGFVHRHENFAFVKDLCYALEAERDRQLILFFRRPGWTRFTSRRAGHAGVNAEGMKDIAVRFENLREDVSAKTDMLLDDFFGVLREMGT